jgi:KDO2-lipid IV(A) lauroyltransferase
MRFKVRRYILYYLARWGAFLIYLLPLKASLFLADLIGSAAYLLAAKYRKIALENLKSAFGNEKTGDEIEAIAKAVFKNLCRTGVELVNFPKITKVNVETFVHLRNREILDAAFGKGKGVIILTGHFGNWELVAAALRLNGYPGCAIGRRIYFHKYDGYLNSLRKIHDVNVVYRDESVKKVLRYLRNNEIVGILADQDVDSVDGVYVNFFGKPAYTPTGPVVLAKATGAEIIPTFMIEEGGRHVMVFEKPLELTDTGDKERDLVVNTQKWSDIFESYIRRYPEEWVWMHERWKTKRQ